MDLHGRPQIKEPSPPADLDTGPPDDPWATLGEPNANRKEEISGIPPTQAGDARTEIPPILAVGPPWARTRFGEYELVRKLGGGAMGLVFEARHVRLDLPVALKFIRAGETATQADVERFLTEARAVAKLHRHQNIAKIYNILEESGEYALVMQLVRGGSLADRLHEFRANPRMAVELMRSVAGAISHAHRRGILHRDLKPENILIDEEGTPYVTDFGLAKRVDATGGATETIGFQPISSNQESSSGSLPTGFQSSQTLGGTILGTPSYMPPEQAQGRDKEVSTLSDVYGLGATLFTLLCGRPPFRGETVRQVLNQVISEPAPSPRSLNSKVDRDLEAICLKCLEKDPAARYESAEAFGRDLERWCEGRPVHARPGSTALRLVKWGRRRPWVAGVVVLVACLGVSSAVLYVNELKREFAEKDEKVARAEASATLRTAGEAVNRLVNTFETELGADRTQQAFRKKVLSQALTFFNGIIESHARNVAPLDRATQFELAKAHQRCGDIATTIGTDQRDEIDNHYRQAIATLVGLTNSPVAGTASPRDLPDFEVRSTLAGFYHEYGVVCWNRGDSSSALEFYEKGRAAWEALCLPCKAHDGDNDCGCQGEPHVRAGLGRSHGYIGDVYRVAGRIDQAELAYQRSHHIRKKLQNDLHGQPGWADATVELGRSFGNLAWLARQRGDLIAAVLEEESGIALLRDLLSGGGTEAERSFDDTLRYMAQSDLADDLRQVADFRLENLEAEKAIEVVRKAIQVNKDLLEARPGVVEYRIYAANAQLALAGAQLALGSVPEARAACEEAQAKLDTASDFEEAATYRVARARWYRTVGQLHLAENEPLGAIEPLERAASYLDKLLERDAENGDYRSERALVLALWAEAVFTIDPARARELLDEAHATQKRVLEANGSVLGRVKLYRDRLAQIEKLRDSIATEPESAAVAD